MVRVFAVSAAAVVTIAALLAASWSAPAAPAVPYGPEPVRAEDDPWTYPDRAVVGFDGDVDTRGLADMAREHGGAIIRVDERLDFAVVHVPEAAMDAFLAAASDLPTVRYAKADGVARAQFTPNDALYSQQWGPEAIQMPLAWDMGLGAHDVTVSVIDTGIWDAHPDLAANVCANGPDYPNGDADPDDDHGHGTHVAGTVAAVTDNVQGVAGMSQACLMAVKVLDAGGSGAWSDVASGIVWSSDNGADILSMSLGGCPGCDPGPPMTDAVQTAHAAGRLIVAAAGNAWCAEVGYPAGYPEVVAVASLDPSDGSQRSAFSSCGNKVEVAAPGRDIISTVPPSGAISDPSGYTSISGTSMATPHVSGLAALAWSLDPALTRDELRCFLRSTTDDLGPAGHDVEYGFGRVNAATLLSSPTCVVPPLGAPILAGEAGDHVVHLTWSAASSFGQPVTGYNLFRGAAADDLSLLATLGNVLAYDDTSAENNVTYHYRISGFNDETEGALSNAVVVKPTPPFVDVLAFDGRIVCSAAVGVKVTPCTALPGHRSTGRYGIAATDLRDVLLEVVWNTSDGVDLGGPMSASMTWPRSFGSGSNSVSAEGDAQPLRLHLRINDGLATCVEGCDDAFEWTVDFGGSVAFGFTASDPNVVVDRSFTAYVTGFYLTRMPDGWSSIPSG